MDTFYGLLDQLSSRPLDATRLQPRLHELASVGLCKQVHRRTQIDDMVDKWIKKIRIAARRVELEELEMESYYSGTDTRSSTASFRTPATTRRTTSTTSTHTMRTSSTAQDEIDSTLRCLEAAREQERVLMRRLASLQTPDRPRTQRTIQDRTASAPSSSDTSSDISSRTPRSQISTSSRRSTSSQSPLHSSSSDSFSPPHHRRASRVPPLSPGPCTTPPHHSRHLPHPSPSNQTSPTTAMSSSPSSPDEPLTPLQQSIELLWLDFPASQISHGALPDSELVGLVASSPLLNTDSLHGTPLTTSAEPTSQRMRPGSVSSRCARTHVRRRPIADECPICYEAMGEEALV